MSEKNADRLDLPDEIARHYASGQVAGSARSITPCRFGPALRVTSFLAAVVIGQRFGLGPEAETRQLLECR